MSTCRVFLVTVAHPVALIASMKNTANIAAIGLVFHLIFGLSKPHERSLPCPSLPFFTRYSAQDHPLPCNPPRGLVCSLCSPDGGLVCSLRCAPLVSSAPLRFA